MINARLDILYEDNHVLAVNKPAELPTMGALLGKPSLLILAQQYIKDRYNKPGSVYLGVVSRLDAPVTGVVVLARTSKAASRLSHQFAQRETEKVYWAVVEQPPDPPEGTCIDWLLHDDRNHRVVVTTPSATRSKEAKLSFRILQQMRNGTLLEIRPETGRKHQIRVQLAARGWPILGDVKYGSKKHFDSGIALHSRSLNILHPVRNSPLLLNAPLPRSWKKFRIEDS